MIIVAIVLLVLVIFLLIKLVKWIRNKAEVASIKRKMKEKNERQPETSGSSVSQMQYYADEEENEATVFAFGGNVGPKAGSTQEREQSKVIKLIDALDRTRVYTASAGSNIVIGHDRGKTDLCIDTDQTISRIHCELSYQGSDLYIRDLNSTNGTYVNGSRVYADAVKLNDGDMIRMGRAGFEIHF